jgi:CRISPR-associated protein Cas1
MKFYHSTTLSSWDNNGAASETQKQPDEKQAAVPGSGCKPIETLDRYLPGESNSRFLHVVEQGAYLHRSGTRIIVTKNRTALLDVPATKLQGVLLYGNIQVSTQCFRNLLEEGVWLSFFSRNGMYKGRLQPPAERGGKLRQMQWERSRDDKFCLDFAQSIVRGKILGQKDVAQAYAKNYLAETLSEGHHNMIQCLERLPAAKNLEELRGMEGSATRAYFDRFRRWNRSEMPFEGREKRGTTDPINALLNFGYMMALRELEGLIEAAGLDPTVGFYHQPDNDRPSLACDWLEEFRHPMIDRFVLKLVNNGSIKVDDFEDRGDKGGLRLGPDGLRKFLRSYEKIMIGANSKEDAAAPQPWRYIFTQQLGRLLDALAGKTEYKTYIEK